MKMPRTNRRVGSAPGRNRLGPAGLFALMLAAGAGAMLAAEDRPVYLTPGISPPERTVFVKPMYPEAAKKDRIEGRVILEIVVDGRGNVGDARVIKSNPVFDAAATEAIRQWKYKPALKDGKPLAVLLTVITEFKLQGLSGDDEPLYLTGDIVPPERTVFVKPIFPEAAREEGRSGKVILQIIVGKSGDVEDLWVVSSDPVFDEAALEAVGQWKYKPALRAGAPVRVYMIVIIEFKPE